MKKTRVEEEEDEDQQITVVETAAAGSSSELFPPKEKDDYLILPLSNKKFTKVKKFAGRIYVDIREYYERDGKLLPGKKGIFLTKDEWTTIKSQMDQISEALENVK